MSDNIVVVDTGSHTCKAGYANPEAEPFVMTPTAVRLASSGEAESDTTSDDSAQYPVQRKLVEDWDALESIWHYLLYEELGWVYGDEGMALLSEPFFAPKSLREHMAQVYFESFNVCGLYIAEQPVLQVYSVARTTGCVVDVGHGRLDICPVLDGVAQSASARTIPFAGVDISARLQQMLRERMEPVDLDGAAVSAFKEAHCKVAESSSAFDAAVSRQDEGEATTHTLPDGRTISVGHEALRCSEAFFQPEALGLGEQGSVVGEAHASIKAIMPDQRRPLYENLVLCGGTASMPGFDRRFLAGLTDLASPSMEPSLVRTPEYMPNDMLKYATWTGGAVLAKVVFPGNQFMNKFDYDEFGPIAIHRKCAA